MNSICKRILAATWVALLLVTFCACGAPYNAEIVSDQASEFITADFYAANYTHGAYYKIDADYDLTCYNEPSAPGQRTFIVDTQAELEEIFKSDADISVDLETEMLVVCTYTSEYKRDIEVEELTVNGDKLSVALCEKSPFSLFGAGGDACLPYQRYVILKLDRQTVTLVDLTVEID